MANPEYTSRSAENYELARRNLAELERGINAELSRKKPLLERIAGGFSGGLSAKMTAGRLQQHLLRYEATEITRLRGYHSYLQLPPESATTSRQRVDMLMAMREMRENEPIVNGILQKYVCYVVGSMIYEPDTGDEALDELVKEDFNAWSETCDITGRHNLKTLAQLALQEERTCGDCGFVWVDEDDDLKLCMVESDCIGNPFIFALEPGYINGVGVDGVGRPVYYRIYRRGNQSAMYDNPQQIPAEAFLHFFTPERVSWFRGVTCFHSVYNTLLDIREMMEAMRIKMKVSAYNAMFVTTLSGLPSNQQILSGMSPIPASSGKIGQTIDTPLGKMLYGAPGEKAEEIKSDFPAPQVQQAIEGQVRNICNALNLSYGLCRDLASLTGPGVRGVLAQDDRQFGVIRDNLKTRFLNPVKNRKIMHSAAMGRYGVPPTDPRLYKGQWYFPQKLTIDIGRQAQEDVGLVEAGLMTPQDVYGARQENSKTAVRKLVSFYKLLQDECAAAGVDYAKVIKPTNNAQGGVGRTGGGGGDDLPDPNKG